MCPCRNRSSGSTDQEAANSNFLVISDLTPLNEVLSIFKLSYSHLMIAASFVDATTQQKLTPEEMSRWVAEDPNVEKPGPFTATLTGVITLEDVIEEVIDHEIVDEHDQYMSNDTKSLSDQVCAVGTVFFGILLLNNVSSMLHAFIPALSIIKVREVPCQVGGCQR